MEDPNRKLFEQAMAGDQAAMGTLLERHLPGLHAYVRLRAGPIVRNKEETADIVQSVCRELLQGLDTIDYRGEAAFRHWLYTTALRKILAKNEHYRALKRDVLRETPQSSASGSEDGLLDTYRRFSSPSQRMVAHEELERIERAFAQLSEEHREVILLAKVTGLSRKEIADQLGKSDAAVRVLLHRALARLSQLLDPLGS